MNRDSARVYDTHTPWISQFLYYWVHEREEILNKRTLLVRPGWYSNFRDRAHGTPLLSSNCLIHT